MERYYPPVAIQIDFDIEEYTAPAWNAVDFAIPYHAPAPDQINFELQPDYQAPAWNNVRFGGGETVEYSISLQAAGPTSTTRIRLSWGAKVPTARLTGEAGRMGWIDAPAKSRTLPGQWQIAEQIDSRTATPWGHAEIRDAEPEMPHNQMVQLDQQRQQPWGTFGTADRANQHRHRVPPALDLDQAHLWDSFTSQDRDSGQPYSHPPAKDRGNKQPYWHVDWYADPPLPPKEDDTPDPDAYTAPLWHSVNFVLSNTGYQAPAADQISFGLEVEPEPVAPNKAIHPVQPGTGIPHNLPPAVDQGNRQPWGTGSWTRPPPDYIWSPDWTNEPTEEPAERPPQPIIQEVYLFMPNITLYRLPDGTEFEATQCVWSTDRDSWGWRFTANLKRDADLAIIKPTSNGLKEIACEINGHTFTALVESYGRNRQHGNTGYTISGRSRTAWLSDPHAPLRSKALTAAYSAAALAEQELANTGFSLQWNAQDWLIPAGSYSYNQLNPISAIKRLAEAGGYMLQSHPELKQLIVSPRYRVDPHKWSQPTTALDAILPSDFIIQESGGFREKPAYNRAIVTGGRAGGVIVTVTRDGTAGDILAPMATDDLITHSDAGYQRGRNLIAEGGTWEEMNITTMLTQSGQAPGLLLPGHLVEIQDTDDTYPVVIDGTNITATSSDTEIKVRQQLTAERRIW